MLELIFEQIFSCVSKTLVLACSLGLPILLFFLLYIFFRFFFVFFYSFRFTRSTIYMIGWLRVFAIYFQWLGKILWHCRLKLQRKCSSISQMTRELPLKHTDVWVFQWTGALKYLIWKIQRAFFSMLLWFRQKLLINLWHTQLQLWQIWIIATVMCAVQKQKVSGSYLPFRLFRINNQNRSHISFRYCLLLFVHLRYFYFIFVVFFFCTQQLHFNKKSGE